MSSLGAIEELEADLIKRNREVAKLRDNVSKQGKTIHEWECKHTEMNAKHSELEASATRAIQEKKELEKILDVKENAFYEQVEKSKGHEKEKETLKVKVEEATKEWKVVQALHIKTVEEKESIKAQLSVKTEDLKAKNHIVNDLSEQVSGFETEIANLKNQLRMKDRELDISKKNNDATASLESEVRTVKSLKAELEKKLERIENLLQEKEGECTKINGEIEELRERLEKNEQDLAEKSGALEKIEATFRKVREEKVL